jgi:radical SAM superfamily enzyme YgiQ (UPF0313 family)
MARPKLLIIVLFQNLGDERAYFADAPAPPLSGALLAALTPDLVDVELRHEMMRPIDYDSDADFVALSFMDYCAPHAQQVARRFRRLGKKVVAGGRYATTFPAQLAGQFDSVVVGEAEAVWPTVVADLVANRLQPRYDAPFAPSLEHIPPPRYDLVEPAFAIPVVTEASRGCPFRCTYCALNIQTKPYRTRPVGDVIRDLTATSALPWHKRKLAMIYDNNFGGDIRNAKRLLRAIAGLDLWGVGLQFTINCLEDEEFVDLLVDARCAMAFIGMESLNDTALAGVNKRHNVVARYAEQFQRLKERGVLIFAGFMVGLEEDTPGYYAQAPALLEAADPSAILSSIAIPIPGTPLHREVASEARVVDDDLSHYEGDHLVFRPRTLAPEVVLDAYERIPAAFYAWPAIARRWWRLMRALWRGRGRHGRNRLFRSALLSFILYQLSRFQRTHGRRKVRPLMAEERAKWRALTPAAGTAAPSRAATRYRPARGPETGIADRTSSARSGARSRASR